MKQAFPIKLLDLINLFYKDGSLLSLHFLVSFKLVFLQEMKQMAHLLVTFASLQCNSRKISQLVGVLTWRWNSHSSTPVEVHVTQFIS